MSVFGFHTTKVDRLRGLASQLPNLFTAKLIVISSARLKRIDGYVPLVSSVIAVRGGAEATPRTGAL